MRKRRELLELRKRLAAFLRVSLQQEGVDGGEIEGRRELSKMNRVNPTENAINDLALKKPQQGY